MSEYPKGNAQVGDHVWIRGANEVPWQMDWRVTFVGCLNKYGNHLNISITNAKGEQRFIAPYPKLSDTEESVLVVPGDGGPSIKLRTVIVQYPTLVAFRDGRDRDTEHFGLFCRVCHTVVDVHKETQASSELTFDVYRAAVFTQHKPNIYHDWTTARCECPSQWLQHSGIVPPPFRTYDISFESYS